MGDKACNCAGCTCNGAHGDGVEVKGKWYCCVPCSVDHLDSQPCAMQGCACGSTGVKTQEGDAGKNKLDNAVDETFPASDPISP